MVLSDPIAYAIDVTCKSWTRDACASLKRYGYARLRLSEAEVSSFSELYRVTHEFFEDKEAMRELEVPDETADRLDERSGYVFGRNREFFELHPECPPASALDEARSPVASNFLRSTWNITHICQRRCDEVLEEIVRCSGSRELRQLFDSDDPGQFDPSKTNENMLRIYRYSTHYDRSNGDVDTHFDMGTLSVVPKSTTPGLFLVPTSAEEAPLQSAGRLPATCCIPIEERMGDDEVLMFVGMTLARLTGIPALQHGVFTDGKVRYSSPFFQRLSPGCVLPASGSHPSERVSEYNQRLRDAENEELRGNGGIVLAKRRDDSREMPWRPWRDCRGPGAPQMEDAACHQQHVGYHGSRPWKDRRSWEMEDAGGHQEYVGYRGYGGPHSHHGWWGQGGSKAHGCWGGGGGAWGPRSRSRTRSRPPFS